MKSTPACYTALCAASFRVLALRRGATLVTAATLRLFGASFAELPFVATKEGASIADVVRWLRFWLRVGAAQLTCLHARLV